VRTYLFIRAQDLVLEGVSGRPPGSSRVLRRALLLLLILRQQVLLRRGPAEAWVLLLLLLQALVHTWGLLLRSARAVACLVGGHALHSVYEAICECRPRILLQAHIGVGLLQVMVRSRQFRRSIDRGCAARAHDAHGPADKLWQYLEDKLGAGFRV
jgi:hypothetical protein